MSDAAVGSERWVFELTWTAGEREHMTPEDRLRRVVEWLACANPHSPVEMAFLIDTAKALVNPPA